MKRVVVATICCDFKAYSLWRVVERNLALETPNGLQKIVYINIQDGGTVDWRWLDEYPDVMVDRWTWESDWLEERRFDQDQGHRLTPICLARNMARYFAISAQADALMYVDSDVLVPLESLRVLLYEEVRPVVGGLVPGRGAHSHVCYTGSGRHHRKLGANTLEVDYGTAGFLLLRKPVFEIVAWRWGVSRNPQERGEWISEDPLYAEDARALGFGWWTIRTDLKAEHIDHPDRPLSETGTAEF